MKRYIIEFSNDMIRNEKSYKSPLNEKAVNYRIERIEKYVAACKAGLITDYETMRAIIDVMGCERIPGGNDYD